MAQEEAGEEVHVQIQSSGESPLDRYEPKTLRSSTGVAVKNDESNLPKFAAKTEFDIASRITSPRNREFISRSTERSRHQRHQRHQQENEVIPHWQPSLLLSLYFILWGFLKSSGRFVLQHRAAFVFLLVSIAVASSLDSQGRFIGTQFSFAMPQIMTGNTKSYTPFSISTSAWLRPLSPHHRQVEQLALDLSLILNHTDCCYTPRGLPNKIKKHKSIDSIHCLHTWETYIGHRDKSKQKVDTRIKDMQNLLILLDCTSTVYKTIFKSLGLARKKQQRSYVLFDSFQHGALRARAWSQYNPECALPEQAKLVHRGVSLATCLRELDSDLYLWFSRFRNLKANTITRNQELRGTI